MLMKDFKTMERIGRKQTKIETLLLQVCIVLVTILSRANSDICTKTSACSCVYSDGSTVDLSPLDSSGGTPRFYDVLDEQRIDMFSWNPCTPFSEGSCNTMAVCQKRPFIPSPEYYSLGDQNSAVFANDNKGKLTLSYKAVQWGVSRTSIITLTCEQQTEGILLVAGEKESTKYYMELNSKYACPKVGPTVTPTTQHGGGNEKKGGLSIGSVLCIVFFCLLGVYLAGGIAFQIFIRKESGRRIIPNISFWSKIPGFTKDGILFVVRKGRGSHYTKI